MDGPYEEVSSLDEIERGKVIVLKIAEIFVTGKLGR